MGHKLAVKKQPLKRLPLCVLVRQAEKHESRDQFTVTNEHAHIVWHALNHAVFGGVLRFPEKIIVQNRKKWEFWGECEGWQRTHRYGPHYTKVIRIRRTLPSAKKFIEIMAHEMVHQYEWERQGIMTHGKHFFAWKDKLAKKGISLNICV
jgi:hypothetical protein